MNINTNTFDYVSFGEEKTIKLLIKNRWRYDKLFVEKHLNESIMEISDLSFAENIIETYITLDVLIEKCRFSKKVNDILYLIMIDTPLDDIGLKYNLKNSQIESIFAKAVNRIVKRNNYDWYNYIETSGIVKIPNDVVYKKCKQCKEWKRKNKYNFKYLARDNYYYDICLVCRNNI